MSDSPDPRNGVRRVPVSERPNKVSSGDFAVPPPGGSGAFGQFYDSLPNILAADSLRAVARGVASALLLVAGPRIQAVFVASTSTIFLRTRTHLYRIE